MDNITYFISLLPKHIGDILNNLDKNTLSLITEIRLRRSKPVIIYLKNCPYFINIGGKLVNNYTSSTITIDDDNFEYITDRLCNRSYHTNIHTMIEGFITAKNGSRVGVASSAVYKDGVISSVKDISSINIRIARDFKNCSRDILNLLYTESTPSIIVAGAVMSGKTTFLRDFSRLLSNGFAGRYRKISIIDERREIANGFDVGINTDVLAGFEKARGIEIATRTLSPDIIVCDEIGNIKELDAIQYGFSTGISFAVSVHMNNYKKMSDNLIVSKLVSTGEFDYIVLLKSFTDEFEIIDLRSQRIENSRNDNDNPFFFLPWFDNS